MDDNMRTDPEQVMKEEIKKNVEIMIQQIRNHVPEYGFFPGITELFLNPDPRTQKFVGKMGLCVYKMTKDVEPDPKMIYLEACAYVPSGEYKAYMTLCAFYKEQIIEKKQKEEFQKRLYKVYYDLIDIFENYD